MLATGPPHDHTLVRRRTWDGWKGKLRRTSQSPAEVVSRSVPGGFAVASGSRSTGASGALERAMVGPVGCNSARLATVVSQPARPKAGAASGGGRRALEPVLSQKRPKERSWPTLANSHQRPQLSSPAGAEARPWRLRGPTRRCMSHGPHYVLLYCTTTVPVLATTGSPPHASAGRATSFSILRVDARWAPSLLLGEPPVEMAPMLPQKAPPSVGRASRCSILGIGQDLIHVACRTIVPQHHPS